MDCKQTFSWFRRRHHCRVCGEIFCGDCSNFYIMDYRVCGRCQQRVLEAQRTFHSLVNDTPSQTPSRSHSRSRTSSQKARAATANATALSATSGSGSGSGAQRSSSLSSSLTARLQVEQQRRQQQQQQQQQHKSGGDDDDDGDVADDSSGGPDGGTTTGSARGDAAPGASAESRGPLLESRLLGRIRGMEAAPVTAAPHGDTRAATRAHIAGEFAQDGDSTADAGGDDGSSGAGTQGNGRVIWSVVLLLVRFQPRA